MYDHIVPICKYYRLNDARPTNNITVSSPVRVRLAAQEIINENCVDLLISVSSEPMFLSESHFALRVRTEQMFTGLQYIQSESLRDKFQTLMNNSNDRLILML